jgi:hypothetical protein
VATWDEYEYNFGALQVPPNMIQNMQYFAGAAAKNDF